MLTAHAESLPSQWALPAQLAAIAREDANESPADPVARVVNADPDEAGEDEATPGARAQANAALRRTIGERLVLARKLNGFDQCEFSAAMGAANSTQTSLWEQGKRLPPLPILIDAARTLGVSVDYLLGESDEAERDPKTAARVSVFRRVERLLRFNAEAVTQCLLDACSSPASDEIRVARFSSQGRALCDAVERFQALNPDLFDDARGGAMLLRTCRELRECLRQVDRFLHRSAFSRTTALAQARALTAAREQSTHHPSPSTHERHSSV